MKVSVSILKEYDRLINAVKKVNDSNADFLHIDVMDGKFVNNTKFTKEMVKDIISISKKKIDLHLMVEDLNLIKEYALLKPDMLTFHVEVIDDFNIIDYVKSYGIKVGLAINPETKIDKLAQYVDDIDLVLFMSVTPGEGGQEFKEEVVDKIINFKKLAPKDLIISIDGGVNNKTVSLCKYAGCDIVVSGSFITNSDNYTKQINELK
mgnify:FL=1